MENIKSLLNKQIRTSYDKYYDIPVDDKFISVINYNTNYSLKSLNGLQKYFKNNNINITHEELCNQLTENIDAEHFDVIIEKNCVAISLKSTHIVKLIKKMLFGNVIAKTSEPKNIIVDFSSPNIAKDMHVGHLRSTIIGDSICRMYELVGHNVHRINHVGDFGLQFGMIIQHLLEKYPDYQGHNFTNTDLQNFYAESKYRFDNDKDFNIAAYKKVILLQSGDKEIVDAWNFIKNISRKAYNEIYNRLDIRIDEVGESFYQNQIPQLVKELDEKGILIEDNGRKVIKINGYDLMLTIIKSDGGYTYDTTDLAAIRYRLVNLNMDKIIYVVDNGQSLHFELIFEVAKITGWIKNNQEVKHVGFGVVLGESGKKFRSRDGNTTKLSDLLDESLVKANNIINENDNNKKQFLNEEKELIVKNVAYGSIKYADLATIRTNDYKFSFDKMISFKGNTGAYQLYEYVRICSILRKTNLSETEILTKIVEFNVNEKEELNVCKMILLFPEVIERINENLMFHILCTYLYDLTNSFSIFHKKCRCLKYNENKEIVHIDYNRLLICIATKHILENCFGILGINKLEKM